MAESIDLTCHEVIIEDYIEPVSSQQSSGQVSQEGSPHVGFSRRRCPLTLPCNGVNLGKESAETGPSPNASVEERGLNTGRSSSFLDRKKKRQKVSILRLMGEESDVEEAAVLDDPIHTVLPIEIRHKLFKDFSTSELLHLRQVSREWNNTINSLLKLQVKIQGNSKDFNGKCGLPMKSCTLVNFQNPAHRHLFKSSPTPEEVRVLKGICYVNFEELVLQWAHLTRLELCWKTVMKNLLFAKSTGECSLALKMPEIFPNLSCLRIEVLVHEGLGERTKGRILSNLTNLTSYNYPSLAHFTMVFVGYRQLHAENRHLPILIPFMNRHANSLDTIDFTLKYASHIVYPPAHPRHILFCVPANLKGCTYKPCYSAVDTHLITTELKKLSNSPEDHKEWVQVLSDKRKLEVAIMTRFLSWSIKHLDFFAPTINEYAKFLRVIELMNITMYDSGTHTTITQLDARVFGQCHQLVELRLFRAPIIFHEDEIDPPTELINFHGLPKTLEEVTVDGLPVASSDILMGIQKLENLKMFHYFQSQVPRRNMLWTNGVTWELLQSILKHERMKFVKVHISTQANTFFLHEEHLAQLATEYGWNTGGVIPGYMNLYQIILSR